ncbi:MAG: hypothetical protein QHH75_01915 [Bacillota bacterium]|nr:hypothetical protein [Bacillota bacterium]
MCHEIVFDGVAWRDRLVVVAAYDFSSWQKITGSEEVEAYKDFLIEQENVVQQLKNNRTVLVIRVPFDAEDYQAWLKANPDLRDGPEARGIWALTAAEDHLKLVALFRKYPDLPRVPEDCESVRVFFGIFLAPLSCLEEADYLDQEIPRQDLEKIVRGLQAELPALTSFERVSRLRAKGARVVVCNHFITDWDAGDVETLLNQDLCFRSSSLYNYTPRTKIRESLEGTGEKSMFPLAAGLLLPVAFHGAANVLDFLESCLEEFCGMLPGFSEGVIAVIEKMLRRKGILGVVPLVPSYLAESLLENLVANLKIVVAASKGMSGSSIAQLTGN